MKQARRPRSDHRSRPHVQRLAPRWLVIRDAHVPNGIALMQPRRAMSVLRGPMTRSELKRAREEHERLVGRREATGPCQPTLGNELGMDAIARPASAREST